MHLSTSRLKASAWRSVGRTHVGRVRSLNEDALLMRPEAGLWAVADGMGGHEAGDVASSIVIEALRTAAPTAFGVERALQRANARLVEYAVSRSTDLIGTTVAVLVIDERGYTCLWAGDSRIYRQRNAVLSQLTHDHSAVQELVDHGCVMQDDARHHPHAHIITRAVGASRALVLESCRGRHEDGDVFLLCSDGLSTQLKDTELSTILKAGDAVEAADLLLATALERGAPDNVSFTIVSSQPS